MNLEYKENDNHYCVPAALALLTEKSVSEACELISNELGDQALERMHYPIILKILTDLGYTISKDHSPSNVKFAQLVCFNGHVGVVKDTKYYDNQYPAGLEYIPKRYGKILNRVRITK